MNVLEALQSLDVGNDDHWTNAGLPAISAVSDIARQPVSRAQIIEAWPGFDREQAKAGAVPPAPAAPAEGPASNEKTDAPELTPTGLDAPKPEGMEKEGEGNNGEAGGPEADPEAVDEPDAIEAIEAALALAQSPRYARNAELQTFVRQWQVQQHNVRAWQDRLDQRAARRAEQSDE